MKRHLVILATAAVIGMAASSAHAHHSHPYFYDFCKSITIEGRVDRVEFKDPHTLIYLRLDDNTVYTVDWAGLRGLTNNGWLDPAKASLVFGARVAVTGNPIRSAGRHTLAFPGLHERGQPEHRRPRADSPCRQQLELGAETEPEPSGLQGQIELLLAYGRKVTCTTLGVTTGVPLTRTGCARHFVSASSAAG